MSSNAIKCRPGFSSTMPFDFEAHQNLSFWISTKASFGIKVNGKLVKSNDYQQPWTTSKYWGELRNGDEITVWTDDFDTNLFMRFKFECLWGASSERRNPGYNGDGEFEVVSQSDIRNEIDFYCLRTEHEMRHPPNVEVEKGKDKQKDESAHTA